MPAELSFLAGFDQPSRYYARNWRVPLRRELVLELLDGYEPDRVLDLGSGDAGISSELPHRHLTAVDMSPAMVKRAQILRQRSVEIVEADLHAFRSAEPYDLILCLGVLAHVRSTEEVFAAIARNSKPGTLAVVQFCTGPLASIHHLCNAFRAYRPRATSRRSVLDAAAKHGFTPIAERRHLLTIPGMTGAMGKALIPYDRFVRRHPSLARWATNHLALFMWSA